MYILACDRIKPREQQVPLTPGAFNGQTKIKQPPPLPDKSHERIGLCEPAEDPNGWLWR